MGDLSQTPLSWDELPGWFPEFKDSKRWLPLLERHYALVEAASRETPVTTVAAEEAPRRLYGESLELLRVALGHLDTATPDLIDIGSGGGYPGLVIAAVKPEWRVTLVEPLRKRARLLEAMARELGLEQVAVVAARAEEAGRGELRDSADLVTARAVAELREVLEYTAPLAAGGGLLALPKGSRLPEEEAAAANAMRELGVEALARERSREQVSATPWMLVLRKTGATPARYPRRPGIPRKRPL